MARKLSQWERVLNQLRLDGPRGTHSFELRREPHLIANPAQRIIELKDRGCTIRAEHDVVLNGSATGARYFLVAEGPQVVGRRRNPDTRSGESAKSSPAPVTTPESPGTEASSLFDLPLPSAYDPFSEAA